MKKKIREWEEKKRGGDERCCYAFDSIIKINKSY
jgi:hypothetical protein